MDIDIKSLQKKILEITIYFDTFCQEHGIVYYLMGGSALGAIRHNGFIPWDDDLDVFMTYENYSKFLTIAKTNIDTDKFYLQKEDTEEWPLFFSKLRMNGTTFLEIDTMHKSDMHQGVYIDIMCLNNVSSNIIYRFSQYLVAILLTAQTISKRGYKSNQKISKKVAMYLASTIIRGRIKSILIKFVRSLNSKNTKMVGHFFGKAPFSKTSFPIEWLGKQRYVPFEDTKLPVPQLAENYLELRFGDYMKIPDQKTRDKYPVHAYMFDLNKNYSFYINRDSTKFRNDNF